MRPGSFWIFHQEGNRLLPSIKLPDKMFVVYTLWLHSKIISIAQQRNLIISPSRHISWITVPAMSKIYRPRHPERTVFYRILSHYFEPFLLEYGNRFERHFGHLRPIIQEVADKYLDCGNPKCGFARIRCPAPASSGSALYGGWGTIRIHVKL